MPRRRAARPVLARGGGGRQRRLAAGRALPEMYFAHSMRKLHVRGGRATGTYWAIFGVVLSTLILPLPEELALLGAGYLARQGSATCSGEADDVC